MTLPPSLRDKVLSEVSTQRSLTRSEERVRRVAGLSLGLAVIVGVAGMRGVAQPTLERPLGYVLVSLGVMLLCALGASVWVLSSGGSALGRPQATLRRIAIGVPVAMGLGALAANAAAPATADLHALPWASHGMCLSLYAALGGMLLVIFLAGLRPLDPVAPGTTGAAVGAVIGAWTSFVVSLGCPSVETVHVLLTHVGPALAFIALGAFLGPRLLTFRYQSRQTSNSRRSSSPRSSTRSGP